MNVYPEFVTSQQMLETLSRIYTSSRNLKSLPKAAENWMKQVKKNREILVCVSTLIERDDLLSRSFDFGYLLAALRFGLNLEPDLIQDGPELILHDCTVVLNKLRDKALILLRPVQERK